MTAQKQTQNYLLINFLMDLMFSFFFATYQLFLIERGMDLLQINLINMSFMFAVFFFEIPTGAIADVWGRKRSTQIGVLLFVASFVVYFYAQSFWMYVLAEVIGALGGACISGALEAWYVDGQKAYGVHEGHDEVFAKEQQWKQFATIIGTVVGAYVGKHNLAYPFLMSAIGALVAFVVTSLVMHEDRRGRKEIKVSFSLKPVIAMARQGLHYGLKSTEVMRLLGLGFVMSAALMAVNMQWSIVFKNYGWGVDHLGWLFAGCAAMMALGGRIAPHYKKRHDQELHALIFSQGLTAIGMIVAGLFLGPLVTLAFYLIHQVGRGMFSPLKQDLLNKAIDGEHRATVISFSSMISHLGAGVGLIASGLVAKHLGISAAWVSSGAILVLGYGLIFYHQKNKSPA